MALRPGLTRLFDAEDLVPSAWAPRRSDGFRVFNPAILALDGGFIMAYRVVSPELGRKIALCRLDDHLAVVPGSVLPLSDSIRLDVHRYTPETCAWHADPRLMNIDGEIWLYWNDGYRRPHNNQFVCTLDKRSLLPDRPRRLDLDRERQRIEKNWGLFFDGGLKGLYSSDPHQIIEAVSEDADSITFARQAAAQPVPGASEVGEIRGGAPPVLFEGKYFCFGHAVTRPQGATTRNYDACVSTFGAGPNFRVGDTAPRLPSLPNPYGETTRFEKLNPNAGYVVYVSGVTRLSEGWLISYGINDEHCVLHVLADLTLTG